MDYELLIKVACLVAQMAHKGQTDKMGIDYFNHPKTVASYVDDPKAKIVAYLHDVIEDTYITEEELRPVFGDEITDCVLILTKDKHEDYLEYIDRVATNPITTTVKLADLKHNMSPERNLNPTEKDLKRLDKYKKAKAILLQKKDAPAS